MDLTDVEVEVSIHELVLDGVPPGLPASSWDAEVLGESIRRALVGSFARSERAPSAEPDSPGEPDAPSRLSPEGVGAAVAGAILRELGG